MQLYRVPKQNSGFTLTEVVVTAIVVGILAAITVPNVLGWFTQSQVKADIADIESALKEAQRQAIRKGKKCTLRINNSVSPIAITATPTGCLPSGRDIDNRLTMKSDPNNSILDISFSYKGNVQNNYTIVLYSSNSSTKKCVYVADGLGIIKQGDYQGSVSAGSTITPSQCILSN